MSNSANNYEQLIDRYVYAVVRQLPSKQRKDIEQELRSLINDMLEERCGEIVPTERDVNVVLAELGKPSELAAKYDPDGERSLIGPRYFRRYVQTMKIVLPAAALGMAVCAILSLLTEGAGGNSVNHIILWVITWLGNVVTTVFSAAALVTLLFAVFEYKGVSLDEDDITKLPAVPENSQLIKKGECVVSIVLSVLVTLLFIFVPEFICFFGVSKGEVTQFIPMFSGEVVSGVWYCWVALLVLSVSREIMGLVDGAYTRRYAIVTAVVNALSTVFVVFALTRGGIMNEQFTSHVGSLFAEESEWITAIFANFNYFLMAVWLFALVLDTANAFVRHFKYSRNNA